MNMQKYVCGGIWTGNSRTRPSQICYQWYRAHMAFAVNPILGMTSLQ